MTKRTMFSWSEDDDAILRRLYLTHSYDAVAAIIGCTPKAARTRRWRLKLPSKVDLWTDAEEAELRTLYEQYRGVALPLDEIAVSMDRSRSGVAGKASQLGLSDRSRQKTEVVATKMGETMREYRRVHGHPRGAFGMRHSEETRCLIGEKSREGQVRMTPDEKAAIKAKANATKIERYGTAGPMLSENVYSRARRGKREDLDNRFFRSAWEANYARYLNWLIDQKQIAGWEYEPQVFIFHGVTRGVLTYTPDFKVIELDGSYCWHEIKGWMDAKSKAKLKRMAKFYPTERIIVIGEDEYKAIAKWKALMPEWETVKR